MMSGSSRRWWRRWLITPRELDALGVAGINMRNARYLLPNNPRRLYRLVDDKLQTKALAVREGIAVPETHAVVETAREAAGLPDRLAGLSSFVVKPARGSGGKGVLVIDRREGADFVKVSGARVTPQEMRLHVDNILAGLFSLGGQRDRAIVEQRVRPARVLMETSYQGAPDIRIVLLHGYPVMAMLRVATRESDGRANLHQGAVGIGIDIATGITVRAVLRGREITHHPDSGVPLVGVRVPGWDRILGIAATCQEMTGLGYLGVDLMVDEECGPMMIEVNARPGLAIQMANGVGLLKRLEPVVDEHLLHPEAAKWDKIAYSKSHFAAEVAVP
jgi:alpha-L-glutamate ligase-like protein